jgi:hypothetical protein
MTKKGRVKAPSSPVRGGRWKATYEDDGTVYLAGRVTSIHPEWLEDFLPPSEAYIERVAKKAKNLRRDISSLLADRPVGLIVAAECNMVIQEVQLYSWAVALQLPEIPIRVIPPTSDLEGIARRDGFLVPTVSAYYSHHRRMLCAVLDAARRRVPLLTTSEEEGGYRLGYEDWAFIAGFNPSTKYRFGKRLSKGGGVAAEETETGTVSPQQRQTIAADRDGESTSISVPGLASTPPDARKLTPPGGVEHTGGNPLMGDPGGEIGAPPKIILPVEEQSQETPLIEKKRAPRKRHAGRVAAPGQLDFFKEGSNNG